MAKPIKLAKGKEFTFKTTTAGTAQSKYPWDEWFNGQLLLIERSVGPENEKGTIEVPTEKKDYEVSTDAMLPKLKVAARRRYKVCQVSRFDADNTRLIDSLIIRARDMTAEERMEEDKLRAEEKAEKAAARAAGNNNKPDSDEQATESASQS